METNKSLIFLLLAIVFGCCNKATFGFPQNGILAGLRSIVSGVTSGLNMDFLDDFSVPDSMVPNEFKVIRLGLCGSDQTKSCICEEGASMETLIFPRDRTDVTFRDLKDIFGKCRPTKCQCPNGEEKLLTLLGCKNGGMPRCRSDKGEISNDGPFGMMDPLVCQNPEKPLTAFDFIAAKTSGSKKCVCQSGYMPVCSKTYLPGMCPDGSLTNRTLTRLPFYLELCKS